MDPDVGGRPGELVPRCEGDRQRRRDRGRLRLARLAYPAPHGSLPRRARPADQGDARRTTRGARLGALARAAVSRLWDRGGGVRHGAGRGDRGETRARLGDRQGACGGLRRDAGARRHPVVQRRVRTDAVRDPDRQLRDVYGLDGRRARREPGDRRPRPHGRGLRSRRDAGLWSLVTHDVYSLPPDLPVPEDDGAADHLAGRELPDLELESSLGTVNVRDVDVLYVYPRSGRPGVEMLPGWDETPGARGCTPQSCAFRDAHAELTALGVRVAGLSSQSLADQLEFAERNHMPFPVVSDPERKLGAALCLPEFEIAGHTLYKRITLVAQDARIAKVFYPVFPPDANAGDVLKWLQER